MNDVPLLVDCDGTLIKTDLLAENFIWVLTHRIGIIPQAIWALFTKGKSSFKRVLARHFDCSQTILPCHQKFLQYLVEQKNLGRKLILCSASDELLLNPLNLNISSRLGMSPQHPLFDACWGSNGKINLAGNQKWERVKREGYLKFDYAGKARSEWSREDREQYNIWISEVSGIQASYNSLAAEYNGAMAKINYAFCNVGQLPKGAIEPLPREFKPYVQQ